MIRRTKIEFNDFLQYFFPILIILIFSGCQKVINVDLNDAEPHIVIEGIITNKPGPYTVMISKSGSYFSQSVLPSVSGAEVVITDNTGTIDTLKEKSPGVYLTVKTQGVPGRTYTLRVMSENKEYSGSTTMHNSVPIDSLNLSKTQSQHFGLVANPKDVERIEMNCFFRDPEEKNFYRIKVSTNDILHTEYHRLYDDQYTNGLEIGLRVAYAVLGIKYKIELYSLDKQTYSYFRTLEDLLDINPVFGSTPANPNSNLNNGALGYFGASAVSTRTITITESLLNELN
jgi:hypothetical protein